MHLSLNDSSDTSVTVQRAFLWGGVIPPPWARGRRENTLQATQGAEWYPTPPPGAEPSLVSLGLDQCSGTHRGRKIVPRHPRGRKCPSLHSGVDKSSDPPPGKEQCPEPPQGAEQFQDLSTGAEFPAPPPGQKRNPRRPRGRDGVLSRPRVRKLSRPVPGSEFPAPPAGAEQKSAPPPRAECCPETPQGRKIVPRHLRGRKRLPLRTERRRIECGPLWPTYTARRRTGPTTTQRPHKVSRTEMEAPNYHAAKEIAITGLREARRPPDHGSS
jgi:hypothetical protein